MKWQLVLMVMFGLGVVHASAAVETALVTARRPLPTGTAIAQDQGIVAMALTESLVRTDTRFVDGKPKRMPIGSPFRW